MFKTTTGAAPHTIASPGKCRGKTLILLLSLAALAASGCGGGGAVSAAGPSGSGAAANSGGAAAAANSTAAATANPASLTFVTTSVGTASNAETITLANTGQVALSQAAVVLSGTDPADFQESDNCGAGIAVGSSCSAAVIFAPTAMGMRNATLSVQSNALASPAPAVALSGSGSMATAGGVPGTLSFANSPEGQRAAAQTFTLTNAGNAALTIGSIVLGGADAGDFNATNNCGASLAANSSCAFTVSFTPSDLGTRTATLTLSDNAWNNPTQAVALSGTGTGASAQLNQSAISFAATNAGSSALAQTLTLSNVGNAALTIGSIAIAGTDAADFGATNNCGAIVGSSASCTITLSFAPSAVGARAATLTLTDNSVAGSMQSVSLTGSGDGALAAASTSALVFVPTSDGSSATAQTVTLSNTGNAALSVGAISITGTNSGDFTQTNTCSSPVAATASCAISVDFAPTAAGTRSANLSIANNSFNTPTIAIGLSGAGEAPVAALSAGSLAFGSVAAGTSSTLQTITVSNTGNAVLTLGSIAITGTNSADFTDSSTCGATLAAAASCTVSVTLTPSEVGTRSATLTISDNSYNSPSQSVGLGGSGTGALVEASPGTLPFGLVNVGVAAPTQVVTLDNTGNAALAIGSIALSGANATDFSQSNNCGSSLAANQTCSVSVSFTPAAAGGRTATLTVSDDGFQSATQTVSLNGTGSAAIGSMFPSWGSTSGGTVVSILGNGFQTGATVTFGSTQATNVTVNSAGTLAEATAPAGSAGAVTVGVTNPDGSAVSLASGFTYTSEQAGCGSDCGDVGDPYDGNGPPANQIPINSCNTNITAGGNYVLTQNIGSDPTALCLQVYYPDSPVNLDLGGFTVTGQVYVQGGGSPYIVMNGTITCDANDGECLGWYVGSGRIHHITIENTDATPLANINITGTTSSSNTVPVLELDHITSTVLAAPNVNRSRNIMDDGTNGSDPTIASLPIEVNNNFLTCSDDASACQGVEMYDAPHSYIHNNYIVLPVTCPDCADSARGVLFDQTSDYGVVAFNQFITNPYNRGVRIRDSHYMAVDDNLFQAVSADQRYAAVHVGETNNGIDDDFVNIFNNTFQLGAGGNGITSTAAADVFAFDNTVTCLNNDCTGAGNFARADIEDTIPADQTGGNITVSNNVVAPLTALGLPAVHACGETGTSAFDCSGTLTGTTTATVCNSGTANGYGTIITAVSPCPVPTAPTTIGQPAPAADTGGNAANNSPAPLTFAPHENRSAAA